MTQAVVALASVTAFAVVLRVIARRAKARDDEVRACANVKAVRALMKLAVVKEPRLAWSATRLAKGIREGEFTSEDIVRMFIEQHHRVSVHLNCIVATRFDAALEEARRADARVRAKERNLPPFLGVPFVSKEVFEYPGLPYTAGLVSRSKVTGEHKNPVVAKLEAAGFILLGTGNISEACMWMEASNKVYGTSNNHYDVRATVGGSSGGTSGAVSALCAPMGLTSDVGGSTRIPAHFNGLFGHKPTGGCVSNARTIPRVKGRVNYFCQLGPTVRHAEDLFPVLCIIKGDAGDPFGEYSEYPTLPDARFAHWTPAADVDVSKLRVVDVRRQPGTRGPLAFMARGREACIERGHERVVDCLARMGCAVQPTDFALLAEAFDIWGAMLGHETASLGSPFRTVLAEGKSGWAAGSRTWAVVELGKWIASWGAWGDHTLPALALAVLESVVELDPWGQARLRSKGAQLREQMSAALGNDAVMILPALPTTAPEHGPLPFLLRATECAAMGIINVMELPSTLVPLGLSEDGKPFGVQVVANHGNDHLCIAVAAALQKKGVARWALE